MTATLDATLDALDTAYWRRVVEDARVGWLRQADAATSARDFAAAYACLDLAWASLAIEPVCVWMARSGR